MRLITGILTAVILLAGEFSAMPASADSSLVTPTARDGSKDFAFLYGHWRTHYMLLRKRLHNSHDWYPCEGTSTITPFWSGSGNLEDGDLRCPNRYIGGLTVRLYNADTHQWSLWWGTRKLGLVPPQQVGHFDADGVGQFYADDKWEGTPVIVRFKWWLNPGDHPRFEQAFSADGGKTWETNWTTDYTRIP
jgi:hypothetical protein